MEADGCLVLRNVFDGVEVDGLRAGIEAAVAVAAAAEPDHERTSAAGNRIVGTVALRGGPGTSVHWEAGGEVVRNLRPVAHLDDRLAACATDPRLTGPAATLLGTDGVALLTSKISYKRAGVGSGYIWHQDHSFLAAFLGARAGAEAVTAMVFLDDADAGNGALRLVPGSHRGGPRPDGEGPRPGDAAAVTVDAAPGDVIVFPTLMLHSSGPNHSGRDRRALLYLYQPPGRPHLDETPVARARPGRPPGSVPGRPRPRWTGRG